MHWCSWFPTSQDKKVSHTDTSHSKLRWAFPDWCHQLWQLCPWFIEPGSEKPAGGSISIKFCWQPGTAVVYLVPKWWQLVPWAFYLRGLRHILGLQPSFIDRTSTNKRKLDEMAKIVVSCSKTKSADYRVRLVSEMITDKKIKLLGHVIREPNNRPTRQVTFEQDSARHRVPNKRRVGRPRKNWIHETKAAVHNRLFPTDPFFNTDLQSQNLFNAATNRLF